MREYRDWIHVQDGHGTVFWLEVELIFYRYRFKNGATVIVTECEKSGAVRFDKRYNLIIPQDDEYNPYDQHSGRTPSEFRGYNLSGVSVSTIVDYMTKKKNEI